MLFHSHVENSCRISTHPVLHFPLLFYSSSGSHLSLQSFHSRTVYSFQWINDKIQFEPKLRSRLHQQRPLLTSWTSSLENEKELKSENNWEAKMWHSIMQRAFKMCPFKIKHDKPFCTLILREKRPFHFVRIQYKKPFQLVHFYRDVF